MLPLALSFLGSGCTSVREYVANGFKVGPNYLRPAAPVSSQWIDCADPTLVASPAELKQWWHVLNDPTLDALIINASQQNLTLREAGFRILQARALRAIAAGQLFPQSQDVAGGYSRNAVSKATANSSFLPNRFFEQSEIGFNLAWELDVWGRFRRAIEAADAALDASVESYDAILVTLLGDIATTYNQIRTLQTRIALAQQNIDLQKETLTIASARFRGGQVSELDVDQATSTLAQTEALVPEYELQLRVSMNSLCVLLGMPTVDLTSMLQTGPIPTAPPELIVGIPAELLRRRPDVRTAERLVATQSARVGIAESELYPHIGITGSVGVAAEKGSDLFTGRAFDGLIGPYFQWNVLNYGRLLNYIRLQDATLGELIVRYQQTVLKANAEVENGIATFIRSRQQAEALARSVAAAERGVRIAVAEYRGGTIDFNRLVLVEQNLVQQQDLLAQAQGAIIAGLIETYRALGGGWEIRLEALPGPVLVPPGQGLPNNSILNERPQPTPAISLPPAPTGDSPLFSLPDPF